MRIAIVTMMAAAVIALAGCGGDNISLCDGCGTPSRTPTPTATDTTPTPTPTSTSDDGLATAITPGPQRAS